MTDTLTLLPPDVWLLQLFSAKSAREGGIVRRAVRDVEQIIGRNNFEYELRRRGYHAVGENFSEKFSQILFKRIWV